MTLQDIGLDIGVGSKFENSLVGDQQQTYTSPRPVGLRPTIASEAEIRASEASKVWGFRR